MGAITTTWEIRGGGGAIAGGIPSFDAAMAMAIDLVRYQEDDDDKMVRCTVNAVIGDKIEGALVDAGIYVDGPYTEGRLELCVVAVHACPACKQPIGRWRGESVCRR